MGIVGKNGSGKSTLLRAIAGIFSADSGSIELETDSVSLLSIGVGFQKKLSGRENIILSGMLLGFSEQEVRDKMDEIIKFANLGKIYRHAGEDVFERYVFETGIFDHGGS